MNLFSRRVLTDTNDVRELIIIGGGRRVHRGALRRAGELEPLVSRASSGAAS
jgi:hypothetical protein